MELDITFAFGRGPKAAGNTKTYSYFTAVTRRDSSVLAKLDDNIKVTFPNGATEVKKRVTVDGIVIPRATETISGTNFEVLVGFELTPEQLEFNRSGKRFLMNVGAPAKVSDQRPAAPAPAAPKTGKPN